MEDDFNLAKKALSKGFVDAEYLKTCSQIPPSSHVSEVMGKYKLDFLIGQGARSRVYLATDLELERKIALKILTEFAPDDLARFNREVSMICKLQHPNIVQVYETGEFNNMPYLAMQYVDGFNLNESIPPLRESIQLLCQICEALDYAHLKGIIHRDVKPANILIDKNGHAYLSDFGVAKNILPATGQGLLSFEGMIIGTPCYMSPEQARGEISKIDVTTDIYSLGATLYYLATKTPPFKDESTVKILDKIVNYELEKPRKLNPSIPPKLEDIILKAMHPESSQRYQSAKELQKDLENFIKGKKVAARQHIKHKMLASILLPFIIAGLGLFVYWLINLKGTLPFKDRLGELAKIITQAEEAQFLPEQDLASTRQTLNSVISELSTMLEKNPSEPQELHYEIARAYYLRNNFEMALLHIDKAIKLANDPRYYYQRALIKINAYQRKYTYIPIVQEVDTSQTESEHAQIINDLEEAIKLGLKDPDQLDVARLNIIIFKEPYEKSISFINDKLTTERDPFIRYVLLSARGQYYFNVTRFEEAIRDFKEVIKIARSDYKAYVSAGRAYNCLANLSQRNPEVFIKNMNMAIEYLNKATNIDPDYYLAYFVLSGVYCILGRILVDSNKDPTDMLDKAITNYKKAESLEINEPLIYFYAALSFEGKTDYALKIQEDPSEYIKEGLTTIKNAIDLSPSIGGFHASKARLILHKIEYLSQRDKPVDESDFTEAINSAQKAITSPSAGSSWYITPKILLLKANLRVKSGADPSSDLDDLIQWLEEANSSFELSGLAMYHCFFSDACYLKGIYKLSINERFHAEQELTKALDEINHAINIGPKLEDFYLKRGMINFYLGRLEDAKRDLKMVTQDPSSVKTAKTYLEMLEKK